MDIVKTIILGSQGCGKSQFVSQLMLYNTEAPEKKTVPTVGVAHESRRVKIHLPFHQQREVQLQIWDTSGAHTYHFITRTYYAKCVLVVLVYDVTNPLSFEELKGLLFDAQKGCGVHLPTKNTLALFDPLSTTFQGNESLKKETEKNLKFPSTEKYIEFVLVGMKNDLSDEKKVPTRRAKEFADAHNMTFIETSKLTNQRKLVHDTLVKVAERINRNFYDSIDYFGNMPSALREIEIPKTTLGPSQTPKSQGDFQKKVSFEKNETIQEQMDKTIKDSFQSQMDFDDDFLWDTSRNDNWDPTFPLPPPTLWQRIKAKLCFCHWLKK